MRLRDGRTSASPSRGKRRRRRTVTPAAALARRARPARGEAQRAERLEDAGLVRHVDRRVAEPATPSAIGPMSAPCPTSTTGPSILLLS